MVNVSSGASEKSSRTCAGTLARCAPAAGVELLSRPCADADPGVDIVNALAAIRLASTPRMRTPRIYGFMPGMFIPGIFE